MSLVADTRHEQFATINFPTINVEEGLVTSAMRRRTVDTKLLNDMEDPSVSTRTVKSSYTTADTTVACTTITATTSEKSISSPPRNSPQQTRNLQLHSLAIFLSLLNRSGKGP